LLDDRDERPGFKFKDADLLGIPYRVTVGKGYKKNGMFEIRTRRDGATEELSPTDTAKILHDRILVELNKG
jgi:prolyl-tRNA synthetase